MAKAGDIPGLMQDVVRDGADAYRAAIAAQIAGQDPDKAWDAWEQDTAALLLASWVSGAATSLMSAGVPLAAPKAIRFAEESALLDFEPGPSREMVRRWMDTVPLTKARWEDLIRKAFEAAAELRQDEQQTAIQKMADRSPEFRALVFPEQMPEEVRKRRTPGVGKAAQEGFFVSGLTQRQTEQLRDLLGKVVRGQETRDKATKKLRQMGLAQFIQQAEDVLKLGDDLTAARLETVYRTNLNRAASQGRLDICRDPVAKKFVPLMQYRATKDPRTRATHKAMDGYVATTEMIDAMGIATPAGFQCFPGDQPITGVYDIGMRASYRGPLVHLHLRSGRRVALTPNHPVLTSRGWVSAEQVHVGDECLNSLGQRMPALPGLGDVEADHRPALAVEVFDALAAKGVAHARLGTKGSNLMLHGDSAFMDGEVDVVWADGELVFGIDAVPVQQRQHLDLVGALAADASLRGSAEDLMASFGSRHRSPRGAALPTNQRGVFLDPAPFEQFGLAPVPGADAPSLKTGDDAGTGTADRLGDLLDALAGSVQLDDVVDVEFEPEFDGHVYDFRSSIGIVVADGIITSNCRCSWSPVPIATAVNKGWCDRDGNPNLDLIQQHNGQRQRLIDSGQFPDPGFIAG